MAKRNLIDATDFVHSVGTGSVDHSYDLANRKSGKQIISFYQVPSRAEVAFKAFLTNFQDSYTSNWKREAVYGRMDPISSFQNTQRQISLSWDVVAGSTEEAIENLRRVGILTQMLYPGYHMGAGQGDRGTGWIDAAPVFKVKFLNLITDPAAAAGASDAESAGLVCTIDGFSNEPALEAGFVAVKDQLFPKVINLSCNLHILHTNPIGFDRAGRPRTPTAPYGRDFNSREAGENLLNERTNRGNIYTINNSTNMATPSKRLREAMNLNLTQKLGLTDAVD